ncbi:helix-turn-helix domain-containing protein [Anatilimnocola sp. NA78]|uniref:helix-turn-helix domain-containing protein n=1 Tax=Anatilimnocola sp. NA78 TaxID=3415683 RepID=UPI003CE5B852
MVGQSQNPVPSLLSAEQVARRLGLSRTAVYALCDAGELKHYRIGVGKKKRFRVSEEQLADYLAGAAADPPPLIQMQQQKRKQPTVYAGASRLRALGWKG